MNPIEPQLLARGLTWQAYRQRVEKNAQGLDEVYAHPAFTEADLDFLRRLPPLTIVAIGEDWCPDVWHTLPTWVRIAEELEGWDLRIFERDQNLELMDCFLYRGASRRIPVYAFYDAKHFLQVWWSGRGAEAQQAVDSWLAGRTFAELDDEARRDIGERFASGYRDTFRRSNFLEILTLLRAFFHLDQRGMSKPR